MRHCLAGLLCIVFMAGCSSIPFQKTPYVPLESVDPLTAVEQFKKHSPEDFQLLNTIFFQYNWIKFSGIGYIHVNTTERTYTVVCINHMGVKLFEITGNNNGVISSFALEEFKKKGDFATVVGEDIKRIFFDLIPSSEAKQTNEKLQIIFQQPFGAGVLEHVFAGTDVNLIEKSYYEDNALIWTVSYYEYQQNNGKYYPQGIILKHHVYGYSLTVKLKEIQN